MSRLWSRRRNWETRQTSAAAAVTRALTLMVALATIEATRRCPQNCFCDDTVETFELTCIRNHGYNLVVEIQPGYYYTVTCDLDDQRALDPDELAPLRDSFGNYTYNSSTIKDCVLPALPLAEILVAMHPAARTELVIVKLDKPRGVTLDSIGLPALRHFIIFEAAMSTPPPALFTESAIDHLVIRETHKSLHLDTDTLRPATGNSVLRTLELSLDDINDLPPRVFVHLPELRRLFLWGNGLVTLTADTFEGLHNLEELDLSRNNLTTVPQALCSALPALRTVNLYDNQLTFVPKDAFSHCSSLEVLELTRGKLKTLPGNVFGGSGALKNLSLASQQLETLPVELFHDQYHLRRLDLSDNKLAHLAPDMFITLGRLTYLSLDNNLLKNLESGVFSGLNSLEVLSVERNRLEHIASDAFRGVGATQLKQLRLTHNHLTLSKGSFIGYSPLHALKGLQQLDLAHNYIDRVYGDWRIVMLQLNLLDLSHNRFTSLNDMDVRFFAKKTIIDFRHNNISKLDFSMEDVNEQADDRTSEVIIKLDNNPLRCDCDIYAAVLRGSSATSHPRLLWDQAECAAPPMMCGTRLTDITPDSFICELDSCTTTDCTCRARIAHRVLEVQCTGVVELPRVEPNVVGRQWHLERTELLLNGSNIDHLGPQDPAPDVTVLDLRDNKLSRLDVAAVSRLFTSRRTLRLFGNPIECDCDNQPLLTSLREHSQQVQDYKLLQCSDGKLIQDLPPGGVCISPTVSIAAALALLAALTAAFVVLYRRFESEMKVWLYARGLCLQCLTEDELDRDKHYDAFVSFSHLDEPFVVGELVPTLETGPHPLRLCVHVRDWPAGEWIPAQIARSVEQSCRTIIVLSPNFLESVWGRVEFRAAHAAALREGRARVVVVLYGESLDAKRLDPELRAYLSTNTYIKWGDPYFWHKLRLELPRRRSPIRLVECAPPLTDLVAARKAGFQDGLELRPAPTVPASAH